MKDQQILYILLAMNILCIHYANCGITSYIGSFFGYGKKTTTTTPLPIIETTTLSTINEEIQSTDKTLHSDNIIDASNPTAQYVPIVYYIPAKDLHQKYPEVNEIKDIKESSTSSLNSNSYSYYPWYHLPPTMNGNILDTNRPSQSLEIVQPEPEKIDHLPKELQDLAEKLGYKDTSTFPSIAVIREALGLSTDQEAIDFVLDLASTEFGVNLIKSYMVSEQLDNSLENNQIPFETELNSANKEQNEIPHQYYIDSNSYLRSDISPLNHDSSPDKTIVRRHDDEEIIETPNSTRLQSSIKRAVGNFEILRKLIRHPFGTGLFGTLRHWTGFFTKQSNIPNSAVPTAYGPKSVEFYPEYVDHLGEGSENKPQILNPNSSEPHYIQYPDGSIYMINPLLFDYYNKEENTNKLKKLDEFIAENYLKPEETDSLKLNENLNASTKENQKEVTLKEIDEIYKETSVENENPKEKVIENKGTHLLKNEFRIENNFESDLKLEEEKKIHDNPTPEVIVNIVEAKTLSTSTTPKSIEHSSKVSPPELTRTLRTTTTEENDLISDEEIDMEAAEDEQEAEESNHHYISVKASDEDVDDKPKLYEENDSLITTTTADESITEQSDLNESNSNESHIITTTTKTTILKPIVSGTEWKPQRNSGTIGSSGQIYRSDPIAIVVPKVIVPKNSSEIL